MGNADETSDILNLLPDEILISIFERLYDAKCLCRCFIVSKRFSGLITHMKIVNLRLVYTTSGSPLNCPPPPLPPPTFPFNILPIFHRSVRYFLRRPAPPSTAVPAAKSAATEVIPFRETAKFLQKFHSMEILRLEVPTRRHNEEFLKWEAAFGKLFNYCVVLMAKRVRKGCGDVAGEAGRRRLRLTLTEELRKSRIATVGACYRDALFRHHAVRHVSENLGKLESVIFTDSENEGTLILVGSQMRNLREVAPEKTFDLRDLPIEFPMSGWVIHWHVPVLQLPASGMVAECVTLFLVRLVGAEADDDIMSYAFGGPGGNEMMREAVWEIYENHKDSRRIHRMNIT